MSAFRVTCGDYTLNASAGIVTRLLSQTGNCKKLVSVDRFDRGCMQ